jgi:uncharacterized protein YjdB
MTTAIKKMVVGATAVATITASLMALSPMVMADTTISGNDNSERATLDTFSNFTIVDTNQPVAAAAQVDTFSYWASNLNPFRFIFVDGAGMVKYVSDQVTPAATGMNTFTPASPVSVQAGWNLGAYFASTGTIPFESSGSHALATGNGSGLPTVGMTLSTFDAGSRTYSMAAMQTPVLTSVTVTPATSSINAGATQQLTASPLDQNSAAFTGAALSYSSSNTAVATVSNTGMVTGVAAGSATITVSAVSGATTVTGTAMVTVNAQGNGDNHRQGPPENVLTHLKSIRQRWVMKHGRPFPGHGLGVMQHKESNEE